VEPVAGAHSQPNRVAQQLNERSPETLGFETRAERDLMLVLHRPIEPTPKSRHCSKEPVHNKCVHIALRWMLERGWQAPNDVEP
jgi:hypothetical protein